MEIANHAHANRIASLSFDGAHLHHDTTDNHNGVHFLLEFIVCKRRRGEPDQLRAKLVERVPRKEHAKHFAFLVEHFHTAPRFGLFQNFGRIFHRCARTAHVEQGHLPHRLFFLMLCRHLERPIDRRHKDCTATRERIQRAGHDKAFQHLLVQRRVLFLEGALVFRDTLAKIKNILERATLFAFGDNILDHSDTHVADTGQPVKHVPFLIRREHAIRRIDIRGKNLDVDALAFLNDGDDIFRLAHLRGHGGRHVFRAVIRLQVGRLVSHVGICGSMALVECVPAEREHRIPHLLNQGHVIALVNALLEKFRLEFLHLFGHLFGHDAADVVSATQRVPAQNLGKLHHLFLVNNHAIRFTKHLFQIRMVAIYFFLAVLASNKVRNLINRPRAVQGVHSDQVENSSRLQFAQVLLHTRRFELEHRSRHALAQKVKRLLVIERDMSHVQVNPAILLDHVHRILNDGQVDESQEVHLQKADILSIVLVVHHHRGIGRSSTVKRRQIVYRSRRNHHATGMHTRLAR